MFLSFNINILSYIFYIIVSLRNSFHIFLISVTRSSVQKQLVETFGDCVVRISKKPQFDRLISVQRTKKIQFRRQTISGGMITGQNDFILFKNVTSKAPFISRRRRSVTIDRLSQPLESANEIASNDFNGPTEPIVEVIGEQYGREAPSVVEVKQNDDHDMAMIQTINTAIDTSVTESITDDMVSSLSVPGTWVDADNTISSSHNGSISNENILIPELSKVVRNVSTILSTFPILDQSLSTSMGLPAPLIPMGVSIRPVPNLLPLYDKKPKQYGPAKGPTKTAEYILSFLQKLDDANLVNISSGIDESDESFGQLTYSDSE